jgi:hypothetical protein
MHMRRACAAAPAAQRPRAHHPSPNAPASEHRSTIADIQAYKLTSLPWLSWARGSKAEQAHELAEW